MPSSLSSSFEEDGKKKNQAFTIFGQDPDVLIAMLGNIVSWFVSQFFPSFLPKLLPKCEFEVESTADDADADINHNNNTRCISIGRPGGIEQLRMIDLQKGIVTKGYNVGPDGGPFLKRTEVPDDCIIVENKVFSINYADCCIRWGLYESAKSFVGWPICPGFDVAGIVTEEEASNNNAAISDDGDHRGRRRPKFQVGDRVFGCSLFGAYSSKIAIPSLQLRKLPTGMTLEQAAAIPAASLTALYALQLSGHYPMNNYEGNNKAILIHSAAGGVGSMLVQMSKLLGLHPVVGVVGSTSKVEAAKDLGCDVVIDKSSSDLWHAAKKASPAGYSAIMDANGVSTLQQSYDHLCPTGRLVVFGFHSNLPMGRAMLSPMEWFKMAGKMNRMPKFDPMDLVVSNKAVLGFNLSFFADEKELVTKLFDQVCQWLEEDKLQCPRVVEMEMNRVGEAHSLIMSGKSIGKIVCKI